MNNTIRSGGFLSFNHISDNGKFAVHWLFIYFAALFTNEFIPVLGNFLLGIFMTLSHIYFVKKFYEEGSLRTATFEEMRQHLSTAFGLLLGGVVLFLGMIVVVGILIGIGSVAVTFSSNILIILVLISAILVGLYVSLINILVVSRLYETGFTFKNGFYAIFYPFTSKGFSELITSKYMKYILKYYLFVIFSLIIEAIVLGLMFISPVFYILIPVFLIIGFWQLTTVSTYVAKYLHEKSETTSSTSTVANEQQVVAQ